VTAPDVTEVILELPVQTFLQLQRHHEEMMREFALIDVDRERGGASDVPMRLLDHVTALRSRYASLLAVLQEQVAAAAGRGDEHITISLTTPVSAAAMIAATCDVLEEADAYCRSGDLLTLATTEDVARFRRSLCEGMVAQLRGV
jgi:hypothetical protein